MSLMIWSVVVGLPALAFIAIWMTKQPANTVVAEPSDHPVLLFRDGILEDASPDALAALPVVVGMHDWDDVREMLSERYPDLPTFDHIKSAARQEITGSTPSFGSVRIERIGQALRMILPDDSKLAHAEPRTAADASELTALREFSMALPYPAWKINTSGKVTWTNDAYDQLRTRLKNPQSDRDVPFIDNGMSDGVRVKVETADKARPEWYAVTNKPVDEGCYVFAICQTDLVAAEEARRDFVQTLAKTFAHLPIGLAIFSRERRLVLFNPALSDLTGLKMQFLGPKPTLDSFFDAMRETRRMPEPKNYRNWRQRINDLVTAAEGDIFEETWTLENGQTLRVTGQPHPEGALAFLIEDISAEVSLTRNFRAELELGQSLLDTFNDALAVFSQSGLLTFSNKAYDDLWGFHADGSFADVTIADALRLWREKSHFDGNWKDIQDTVLTFGDRDPFEIRIQTSGTAPILCRVVPITAGATMIQFIIPAAAPANHPPLVPADE